MGKIFVIIGSILAAVIVVAITVTIHEVDVRETKRHVKMFDIAPADIDRITIEGPNYEELSLQRDGKGWILPDLGDFPADKNKVEDMLSRLLAIEEQLPLDSSPEAVIRFKVSDEDFERRVTLFGGDAELAGLYIGTPEGPRQVHARRAGDNTVYAVDFGLFDASIDNDDWFDHGFLQMPVSDIAAIEVYGLRLVPDDKEGWRLDGSGAGDDPAPTLDVKAAARLASLLADLRVDALLDDETAPDYALDTPRLTLSLTRKDGTTIDYALGRTVLQKDYSFKVSTRPEHFHLSSYTAHQLIEAATREALLTHPETGGGHAAAAPAAQQRAPATARN